jgi:hypothetical protein
MMAILNSPSEEDFFAVAAEPHGIINPGRQFELISQFDDPFSDQEVALIRAGNPAMLYIWGEVKYVDAFDNPRYLKFRFRYGGTESIRYRRIALCERAMMQANAAHMREARTARPFTYIVPPDTIGKRTCRFRGLEFGAVCERIP